MGPQKSVGMRRVIFIGQAMPRNKEDLHDWKSLNLWLYSIGITDEQIKKYFYYTALVDYFPGAKNGSHLVPTGAQIEKERPRLKTTISGFDPQIIVTVGRHSLEHCLNIKVNLLSDFIGQSFKVNPYNLLTKEFLIIPLPHPSGASTWRHKPENKKLLLKALTLLKNSLS